VHPEWRFYTNFVFKVITIHITQVINKVIEHLCPHYTFFVALAQGLIRTIFVGAAKSKVTVKIFILIGHHQLL
jgi:hypothetical protein